MERTFEQLTGLPELDGGQNSQGSARVSIIRAILAVSVCATITIFAVSHAGKGSTRPTAAEISFLARDAQVVVGEVPLVLPSIAFFDRSLSPGSTADRARWWQEREAFRLASSDPATAPELQSVNLYLSVYGWAKDTQTDARKPEGFDRSWTTGGGRRGDHIRAMTLLTGVLALVFDRDRSSDGARYCTVAVRVEKHLMAVWSVGDWGGETAEVKAAREGRVLVGFLRFGLRLDERYPDLKAHRLRFAETRERGWSGAR